MKALRLVVALLLFWICFSRECLAGTLAAFHIYIGVNTYLGDVDVELFDQDKPVTVSNFIRLVQSGAYHSSFFHRCQPGFVLQGGGYYALNPLSTNLFAPPYANLGVVPNFGNITNEFNTGPFHSNTNGTIAMAKLSGDPNSANSQFFFNLHDNSASLDDTNNNGGFTVFGQVIQGLTNVDVFNGFSPGNGIVDLTATYGTSGINSLFTELPTIIAGTNAPPDNDLIYFTVSILTTRAQMLSNGVVQISWLSVANLTNNLEYSTNLPPDWRVLAGGVGDGFTTFFVNDSSTNQSRFYRVHVIY
jgi:cyclophilin family peptidyl-prolyl cis-trans isomerase